MGSRTFLAVRSRLAIAPGWGLSSNGHNMGPRIMVQMILRVASHKAGGLLPGEQR